MSTHIAIIGIDGSGKSTCFRETLKVLSENSSVAGIGDDIWLGVGCRDIVRTDNVRWATPKMLLGKLAKRSKQKTLYQITKFAEVLCRVNVQNALVKRYSPKFLLTDGSPLINTTGWAYFYHPQYFTPRVCTLAMKYLCREKTIPLSRTWFYLRHLPEVLLTSRLNLAKFTCPDLVFFLHVSPDISISRIMVRDEKRQVHETHAFLDNLQKAYEMVCNLVRSEFGSEVHRIAVDDLSILESTAAIVEHIKASS